MRNTILVVIKSCYSRGYSEVPIKGKILKLEYSDFSGYYMHVNEKYPMKEEEDNLKCWYIPKDCYIKITKENKNAIKQHLKNIKNDR